MTEAAHASFQRVSGMRDHTMRTPVLTPRERQILALIGKGKTTKEIATILQLSTLTVGNHRKGICRKLDIHSTAELVYRAAMDVTQ